MPTGAPSRSSSREIAPAGTSWSPGTTGPGGGRAGVSPLVKPFAFLLDKRAVPVSFSIDDRREAVAVRAAGGAAPRPAPRRVAPAPAPWSSATTRDDASRCRSSPGLGAQRRQGRPLERRRHRAPRRVAAAALGPAHADARQGLARATSSTARSSASICPGIGAINFVLHERARRRRAVVARGSTRSARAWRRSCSTCRSTCRARSRERHAIRPDRPRGGRLLAAPLAARAALAPVRPLALGRGEPSRAFFVCAGSDVFGATAPLDVCVPGVVRVELFDVVPAREGAVSLRARPEADGALVGRSAAGAALAAAGRPVPCAAAVPAAQSEATSARAVNVLRVMVAPIAMNMHRERQCLCRTGSKTRRPRRGRSAVGRPEKMVRPAGIEPATPAFGGQYSIH